MAKMFVLRVDAPRHIIGAVRKLFATIYIRIVNKTVKRLFNSTENSKLAEIIAIQCFLIYLLQRRIFSSGP